MFSIGLRYCGGGNPQIDRSRVLRGLKEGLDKQGLKVTISTDRQRAFDLLLLINGCMRACLEEEYARTDYGDQIVSVRGEMVDDLYMPEEAIPGFLIEKITGLF